MGVVTGNRSTVQQRETTFIASDDSMDRVGQFS